MSLVIYADKKEVPAGMRVVDINDLFFDTKTKIVDSELTRKILKDIDKAEYHSEKTFVGRTENLGALNKSMLSTGTKTLLNVIAHPDVCFDVCECGGNALSFLSQIKDGAVLWELPVVPYTGQEECDLVYRGKHFTNFYDFLEVAMNEER